MQLSKKGTVKRDKKNEQYVAYRNLCKFDPYLNVVTYFVTLNTKTSKNKALQAGQDAGDSSTIKNNHNLRIQYEEIEITEKVNMTP